MAQLEDAGEEQALRLEEERLADAGAYRESGLLATELVGGDGGALDLLGRAGTALAGREGFESARARIVSAAVELADVSRSLRDDVEGWEDDPDRLAEVQERRRLLAELRRKYGEDLAAVMAYGASAAARLAALEDAEGEAARLQAEQDAAPARTGGGRGRGAGDAGRRRRQPSGNGWRRAWATWPWAGPASRWGWPPRARASRSSCCSGRTWASRCSRWPRRPRAASWPGPCWPSASSAWAGPRRWSSTRSTPAWAGRPPWPWARRCTR